MTSASPESTTTGADEPDVVESTGTPDGATDESSTGSAAAHLLEREGDIAADYLEVLLDIADVDGDIDIDVDGNRAVVSIIGDHLAHLVGRDGETLEALQELTRLAVLRETGVRSRLMLDVAGHRAARRTELTALGTSAARRVLETGSVEQLVPMTPFERKIVHDAVSAVGGVASESAGDEPNRFITLRPA